MSSPQFQGLDHIAIVVPDTQGALKIWCDQMGLPFLYSEIVNGGTIRLTHLDLGNTHLQLVEPLSAAHPLHVWLAKQGGSGLHHLCLRVEDVDKALADFTTIGLPPAAAPHQGTRGKRALFLDKAACQGIQLEVTGQ